MKRSCSTCLGSAPPHIRCQKTAMQRGVRLTNGNTATDTIIFTRDRFSRTNYRTFWIDFRGIQDVFMREKRMDYFENSRRATYVQQQYAIHNPLKFKGYGEFCWGITASEVPGLPSSRSPAWIGSSLVILRAKCRTGR